MSRPVFLLQIVDALHGAIVTRFPGGDRLERDFVEACTRKIVAKGVGLMRSQAHVEADIRAGIDEAITELKLDTVPLAGRYRE